MLIRAATVSDLDALTWVLIGASRGDPAYAYRYPKRHLYPEDFDRHCRLKCIEYLTTCTVVVFESPSNSDPEKLRVVAFSVWEAPEPCVGLLTQPGSSEFRPSSMGE
jgi:hypothetical protein